MKFIFLFFLIFYNFLYSVNAVDTQWHTDVLGDGYEARTVEQGSDYSGRVVSTIIRKRAMHDTRRGVLYVHGFNDYFFQAQMGDEFISHGYDFYAVDLRKYGRSWIDGQKRCQVRSITEYYADIDSAVCEMTRSGIREIVLLGHSTGGLITACYVNDCKPTEVMALILNSPFLDWNLGSTERLIPLVSWWGKWFPSTAIKQGLSTAYGESLLKRYHGEWDFNTKWKSLQSPDVDAGWVRAITEAQNSLRDGKCHIAIPVLVMYSSRKIEGSVWNTEFNKGDAVLDPNDIRKFGAKLGTDVTLAKVTDGLHDLFLSSPNVRKRLYKYVFEWLQSVAVCQSSGDVTNVRAA